MAKVKPNNGSETKSDIFSLDKFKPDTLSFIIKKDIKMFQIISKSEFLSFMTKVNPNNKIEKNSDIFSWDIIK